MSSKKIYDVVVEQLKEEQQAAQIYKCMSMWCENNGYVIISNFFNSQVDEELSHFNYGYDFLIENGFDYNKPTLENDCNIDSYKSILDLFESSLKHEKNVTTVARNFMSVAKSEDDKKAILAAQWFLDEQQDDEDLFQMIIDDIGVIGTDNIDIIENMLISIRQ